MIPSFFIVGAMRSGTTSFYRYLAEHPKIFMCKYKEPAYFSQFPGSKNTNGLWSIHGDEEGVEVVNLTKEQYSRLFDDVKDEIAIGEASVQYLLDPTSPMKIKNEVPNAKIIIILRNPIERAFSHYLGGERKIIKLFSEVIENDSKNFNIEKPNIKNVLVWGLYSKQVERYFRIFGKENVRVFIYEEIFPDKIRESIKEILELVGITGSIHKFDEKKYQGYYTPRAEKILKSSLCKKIAKAIIPKKILDSIYEKVRSKNEDKPSILEDDKKNLENFFREDIKKLEIILGKKLPWITNQHF
jgi:hypothetical protein